MCLQEFIEKIDNERQGMRRDDNLRPWRPHSYRVTDKAAGVEWLDQYKIRERRIGQGWGLWLPVGYLSQR